MTMPEMTLMYVLPRIRGMDIYGYELSPKFNAVHVVSYSLDLSVRRSKKQISEYVKRYKIRNLFRYLTGRPLLKPRKSYHGRWHSPSIIIEFVGGRTKHYYYNSNRVAICAFDEFDAFMKANGPAQ